MQDTTVELLADALERFGLQYLATIGLDGKPKVRPIQFMTLRDRKMWFCTNNKKSMYAELQSFPHVEICASSLETDQINSRWVRFSAEAVFPPRGSAFQRGKYVAICLCAMQYRRNCPAGETHIHRAIRFQRLQKTSEGCVQRQLGRDLRQGL